MNPSVQAGITQCAQDTHGGRVTFGTVVQRLLQLNVESYHADYREPRVTYYLPSGETLGLDLPAPDTPIADAFDAVALVAAIRAAQRDEIRYPAFMDRSMAAGCVGYIVWLQGKQVSYFGRRGQSHVEHFPKP